MEYRVLGATGLLVSALGFGGNDLGRDRRRDIAAETLRTIAAALDHGVTLLTPPTRTSQVTASGCWATRWPDGGRTSCSARRRATGSGRRCRPSVWSGHSTAGRREISVPPHVALVGRQPFGHGDLLTSQVQPEWAASPVCTPARTALTYALRLEGLASVPVGMRRYEHLHENVDTVACLSVTRQS
jgi:hypothetical protein